MSVPLKEDRRKCWDARDIYFKCLEENNEDKTKCQKYRAQFETSCSSTWVKYFDRRRDYLKYSEKLEAGFDPVNPPKT
ncbi:cytochrome c oxidase assembly factor 6 homolog [Gigantopelta aegis]|uniref:cytochrome c oxidase assembly factor 6 homolog n=1 Tax=Gigantopelta aegis TaxID=1735272 RepID=UPI001B88D270|nr:cytochrome c oxidase assembly factor 6 homolog [Gigantopelta aegis]